MGFIISFIIFLIVIVLIMGGNSSPTSSPSSPKTSTEDPKPFKNMEEEGIKEIIFCLNSGKRGEKSNEKKQKLADIIQILKSKDKNNDQKLAILTKFLKDNSELEAESSENEKDPNTYYFPSAKGAKETANYCRLKRLKTEGEEHFQDYGWNIASDLTEELRNKGVELGFSKEQCKEGIDIGLKPGDYELVSWLVKEKSKDNISYKNPAWVLNNGDIEKLKQEFKKYKKS